MANFRDLLVFVRLLFSDCYQLIHNATMCYEDFTFGAYSPFLHIVDSANIALKNKY